MKEITRKSGQLVKHHVARVDLKEFFNSIKSNEFDI